MAASRIDAVGDRPLRVAIAGAGFVAPFHIRGWQAQPGIRVVAICALDTRQAEERARREKGVSVGFSAGEKYTQQKSYTVSPCFPGLVERVMRVAWRGDRIARKPAARAGHR